GIDAKGDLERYIMRGEQIQTQPSAVGKNFVLFETEKPSFDPGFSLDDTFKTRKISGVVEGGSAYRAGLRDGMGFVDIINSNRFGNDWQADKPMTVVVKVDGKEQSFDFFPRGK